LGATVLAGFLLACPASVVGQTRQGGQPARKPSPQRTPPPSDPLQQLLAKAEEAIEKEDYASAAAALEQYLLQKPDDARAHFQLGYAYTALQQAEKAKTHYQRAVELDPKLAAGHLNLGLVLLDLDPSAAVAPLRKAAELLPDQARPRFLLGIALEGCGKTNDAIAEYAEAERLAPRDYEVVLALGRALLNRERYAEAEARFRIALSIRPDAAPPRLGLAESLVGQNKADAAAAEYAAYLKAKPDDYDARLRLATLYVDLGRFEPALAELQRLKEADRHLSSVYRLRAETHQKQKRLAEAAQDLQKATELEPTDAELRARRGRVLLELRDFPAAERELLAALQLQPEAIDPLRDLVAVYYLGENYPAALRALERLAQRETLSPGSWFVRATCYDKLGTSAEAIAAYQKFLDLDQGKSEKQDFQARQRIKTLTRMLEKKK
jgi:Flp pilus assembly protein TadD